MMDQQPNRRKFLKNSAMGLFGFLQLTPGMKDVSSPLPEWHAPSAPKLKPNTWSRMAEDLQGARRFSSFRYVPDIDRFLLWGFYGFISDNYGNPEEPWTDNKEYDMVSFNLRDGHWENHLPKSKQAEWSKALPPMHQVDSYMGITPGYYYSQLKEREGVVRPDLNIVGDQVTFDSKRRRMVYFIAGRTFAYDVTNRTWSDIAAGVNPPPVSFGSLCYDPFNDRIVLFGGGHVAEPGPDGRPVGYTGTWMYDCGTSQWTRVKTSGDPSPRMCARMVCDTKHEVMVVFGGDAQTHWLQDTWKFDLKNYDWVKSKSTRAPEARAGHFAVYDPATGFVLVGGGFNRKDLTDMWAYAAADDSWRKVRADVPTGFHVTADIIPEKSVIVLTTSRKPSEDEHSCNEIYPIRTTWAYSIKKEGLLDESAVASPIAAMLKRPAEEALAGSQPDPERQRARREQLRNAPTNQWIHFENPGRIAPVRTWGSCSFDTDKGRIIYWGGGHCGYGGNDYDFYDVADNTWRSGSAETEFPERSWDKGVNPGGVTFRGGPWIRHGRKVYAYDPVSKKVINMKAIYLTSGYEPEGLREIAPRRVEFGDRENRSALRYTKWPTWVFHEESQQWEILCSGSPGLDLLVTTPHGVMGVDYNWGEDGNNNRTDIRMWQGHPMVENAVYLLSVADRNWKKLTNDGPWPQNLYELTALVYDSKRDQLLLHGGGEKRDELWRFGLRESRWEKIIPQYAEGTEGRGPVCNREAVYLPKDDVFLTLGGGPGGASAIWAYRVGENRWYKLDIQPPEGRTARELRSQNRAWAYDPDHDLVLMVLGESGNASRAVVYAMRFAFDR
jgi:hypothetical protein